MTQNEFEKQLSNVMQLPVKNVQLMLKELSHQISLGIRASRVVELPMFCSFFNKAWGGKLMHNLHGVGNTTYPLRTICGYRRHPTLYKNLNPTWLPSRDYTDFRIYPDCDLSNRIYAALGTDLWQVRQFVYAVSGILIGEVTADNVIAIRYLGTFWRRTRAAYNGRNPHTGATMLVPQRYHLKFRVSPILKQALM